MENLRQYARRVDRTLSRGEQFSAYSQDTYHAVTILVAVFKYAKEEVLRLSNKLDHALYGNFSLLEKMEGFLRDRRGSLRILVETDIDREHPIAQLAAEQSCNISIRHIPYGAQYGYKYNFLVVDNTGYRYAEDRAQPGAFWNINKAGSEKEIDTLRELFESLSKKSNEPLYKE